MAATYESIMSDLKAGKYANIYILQGDEPYYIDQISGYIENIEKEAFKSLDKLEDVTISGDIGNIEESCLGYAKKLRSRAM